MGVVPETTLPHFNKILKWNHLYLVVQFFKTLKFRTAFFHFKNLVDYTSGVSAADFLNGTRSALISEGNIRGLESSNENNVTPELTVLMAVYNGEETIGEAIKSILIQSFWNFEFIIIDDGSTDSTVSIIRSIPDTRIRLITHQDNKGLPIRLNEGLRLARGNYLARMDADDISVRDRFYEQISYLKKNHKHLLVGSAYILETAADKRAIRYQVASPRRLRSKLLFSNNIAHPSVMFNIKILDASGLLYDESFRFAQDYDLWTRAILKYNLSNIRRPLIVYRKFANSSSVEKSEILKRNFTIAQKRYISTTLGISDEVLLSDLSSFFSHGIRFSGFKSIKIFFSAFYAGLKSSGFSRIDYNLRLVNCFLYSVGIKKLRI
jgi:glycosyltransferase involved in cell wall biosynthesis